MSSVGDLVDFVGQSAHWTGTRGIPHRTVEHLRLSATALVIAGAVALPTGAWLGHLRRGGVVVQWVVNAGRAIPSLAVVALVLPISLRYGWGLGFWPTVPALVLLAVPAMFANTYAGVRGVDPAVVEAARGMGLRPAEVLRRVEVPTAMPLILAGVRVAALQVVATATLAAWVGYNGLGSYLFEGFAQHDNGKLLTGAVTVAVLALGIDALLGLLVRRATPWRTVSVRPSTKGTT